ncbi:MAG TPA: PKD domain-containing protein [Solirubrobacteraceae bacterium]|nr:PKD domain-containing protein [Solirubrobacteraceae bacterium]
MGRPWLLGALVGAWLLWPAAALGADATITVGPGRTLSPSGGSATINPDDTVTWRWAAGSDEHHIASVSTTGPEVWNSGERTTGEFAHTFVRSGAFAYRCVLHPDDMRGTITVTGAPQARLALPTPAQPFADETVSFDGSASSDPDGSIVSYAWDFDGNGTLDETSATATTAHAYPTAGTFTVRLRVTDNRGNTHDATRSIAVRSRVPTATIAPTPATVSKGQAVSFDGSGSSDADGTIVKFEWNLDGAGFVEGPATTSRSYAAAGPVTIGLRVTDNDGRTAEATRTVTVTNAAPVAAVTASSLTPANGADVTFDAGGSGDTDGGTISRYQWDLDGDGVFETDGGATPTITRSFTTPGGVTVRVRVTDDESATAVASVTLNVAPPPPPPPGPAPPAPPNQAIAAVQSSGPSPPGLVPIVTPSSVLPLRSGRAGAPVASPIPAQRLRRQRGVRVRVSCSATCRLVLTGTVKVGGKRLRLGKLARALGARQAATLTLKVDRRDLKGLRRARGKAKATITLRSTSGGRSAVQTLAMTLAA